MVSPLRSSCRQRLLGCALAIAAVTATPAYAAQFAFGPGDAVVGNPQDAYTKRGDNLQDLARQFDVGYTEMVAANPGIEPWSPPVGRRLAAPTLFVLPDAPRRGIVINLAERRLYYYPPGGKTVFTYPIGIGAIGFTTPLSTTTVVRKEPNPVWIPPQSIRDEQPDLPERVGPGPDDPLGLFALRLGWPNYLIHGTNKPDGVGRNVSHGCIHLYPEDIEQLFKLVAVGTPVRVVEQPFGVAWIGIGLYLEVHPSKEQADALDTDQPVPGAPVDGLREQVAAVAGQFASAVDWDAVDRAAAEHTGLPVLIAQRPPPDMASGEAPAEPPPLRQNPDAPSVSQQDAGGPVALPPPASAPGEPSSLTPIFNMLQPPPGMSPTRPYGDD